MIKTFKHKGLERFFTTGSTAGIQANQAIKLRLQLATLHAATSPKDMNAANWILHPLKGTLDGYWSIRVNGNWRVTFRFVEGHAEIVDYQDYH
jgi:proteic killer suppression protein